MILELKFVDPFDPDDVWTASDVRTFNRISLWHDNGRHTWHSFRVNPPPVEECTKCTVRRDSWESWRAICEGLTPQERRMVFPG